MFSGQATDLDWVSHWETLTQQDWVYDQGKVPHLWATSGSYITLYTLCYYLLFVITGQESVQEEVYS